MKVFISWSGNLSRQIGEAIRDWLPSVIQSVKPYFTPNDIDKGARWQSEISRELHESQVGIFCITAENLNSQWLMFEAGAISKVVGDSYVCPILFQLSAADVSGPLQQFQLTLFTMEEMRKLLDSINKKCGEDKLDKEILDKVFEKWWPDLKSTIDKVLNEHVPVRKEAIRTDRAMLEEILALSRMLSSSYGKRIEAEKKALLMLAISNKFRHKQTSLPQLLTDYHTMKYDDFDIWKEQWSLQDVRDILCSTTEEKEKQVDTDEQK